MTLREACEPLFQYICRLNRSARMGAHLDASAVRGQLTAELADIRGRVSTDPTLSAQVEKVELPLIYFIDFMIKESDLPFAGKWREMAHDRNKLAGDEEFFDLLDETLADSSPAATERLGVFYACLGLGFTGFYTGQPEYLRKKMLEMSTRLRGKMDFDMGGKLCSDAYEHTDTSNLIEPPGKRLVGMVIALLGLVIVLFVVNVYLYRSTSQELRDSLSTVEAAASQGVGTP